MKIIVVKREEVELLLPMERCIQIMRDALKSLTEEKSMMPLRSVNWLPDKTGLLATMPAFLLPEKVMGLKIISVFFNNAGTEFESHQGGVMLFSSEHGQPLAIIDAAAITGIRTAAVSAAATDILARKQSEKLALLGSGIQASAHLKAISLIRDLKEVKIWSIPHSNAEEFITRESPKYDFPITAVSTSSEAVRDADIICTVTPSQDPILFGRDIKLGTHINAIGACTPNARELDTESIIKSKMFVDLKEATLNEAGDFLIPKKEGAISDDHILGDIGELLLHRKVGRESDSDITLYKSLGLAVEDIAAAYYVYKLALKENKGQYVNL